MFMFWRYRIITFPTPRMTRQDSLYRQPTTFDEPVHLQGFDRIVRTSWLVSAIFPQPRRYCKLIKLDQRYQRKSNNLVKHPFVTATKIKDFYFKIDFLLLKIS